MFDSPIKLSIDNRAWDYQLSSGVTLVRGVPVTDHIKREIPFLNSDIDTGDDEFDLVGHGLQEGDPITFREGGTLQTGLYDTGYTYYCKYVDADHFKIALYYPGRAKENLADDGVGTNYIQVRQRARYVLPCNYGSYPIAIRPTNDPSYSMDTDDELVLLPESHVPIPLNVMGYWIIAAESIGGDGDLRIAALENM